MCAIRFRPRPAHAAVTACLLVACGDAPPDDAEDRIAYVADEEPETLGFVDNPVKPLVKLTGSGVSGFVVETGARLPLQVSLPATDGDGALDLTDVEIDPFVVRLPGGRSEAIVTGDAAATDSFHYTFAAPGTSLVAMCAKRESPDPLTYCSKSVVVVAGAGEPRPGADVTAKLGTQVELRPLKDTPRLRDGSELPVRAYLRGHKAAGARISAHRPDGSVDVQEANATGTAYFRLDQSGPWTFRFAASEQGRHYLGELAFVVSGGGR